VTYVPDEWLFLTEPGLQADSLFIASISRFLNLLFCLFLIVKRFYSIGLPVSSAPGRFEPAFSFFERKFFHFFCFYKSLFKGINFVLLGNSCLTKVYFSTYSVVMWGSVGNSGNSSI